MSCSWGSTSWPHPPPPRGPTSQVVTLRVRCQHRHPGVGWGDKDIRSAAPHRQQTFTGGRGSVTEWVMVSQQSKVQPWRRGKHSFGPMPHPRQRAPAVPWESWGGACQGARLSRRGGLLRAPARAGPRLQLRVPGSGPHSVEKESGDTQHRAGHRVGTRATPLRKRQPSWYSVTHFTSLKEKPQSEFLYN